MGNNSRIILIWASYWSLFTESYMVVLESTNLEFAAIHSKKLCPRSDTVFTHLIWFRKEGNFSWVQRFCQECIFSTIPVITRNVPKQIHPKECYSVYFLSSKTQDPQKLKKPWRKHTALQPWGHFSFKGLELGYSLDVFRSHEYKCLPQHCDKEN